MRTVRITGGNFFPTVFLLEVTIASKGPEDLESSQVPVRLMRREQGLVVTAPFRMVCRKTVNALDLCISYISYYLCAVCFTSAGLESPAAPNKNKNTTISWVWQVKKQTQHWTHRSLMKYLMKEERVETWGWVFLKQRELNICSPIERGIHKKINFPAWAND